MRTRRCQRGLVTVELALSTLVVLIILALLAWGLSLVLLQLACQDTASAVARQAARGDRSGVAAAGAARPPGAEITVERDRSAVRVRVQARSRPPAGWGPAVTVRADATAVPEPGSS